MSELKKYIDATLKEQYSQIGTISRSDEGSITVYKKNSSDEKLLLIESLSRNDEVFRKLKKIDCCGYLPNIYEVCSEEDRLYVLEEYVEGKSLAKITSEKKLDNKAVINYLIDICSALEILHSNNIIHRDVKPANVIIRGEKACLIDLSIARMMSNSDGGDTENLGTIGYAAPEQFGLSQSLPVTDIYALGVLANVLLLGVHPSIDVPKGKIGKIINKCTEIQISRRYQHVSDLKKDLYKLQ